MVETSSFLTEAAELVNARLEQLMPAAGPGPERLRGAIRWSLFAGGKRFRPALVLAVGRMFGAADRQLLDTAAAIEMIHTYSLIHDDLPSMDNDDLRRGRETCHKKFGEATAILAGDALQALAFQTIAAHKELPEVVRIRLLCRLGAATWSMVSGQQLDLESEGESISADSLRSIHSNKTGALISFSAFSGALIAGASDREHAAIERYGEKLGLLFQIVDDLLDITETSERLGKTAGKDLQTAKATYPSLFGLERSQELAQNARSEAIEALAGLDTDVAVLVGLASHIIDRDH
ncbi:MAG TPA: polyprenyl synthetase family protein [Pyrinomonadaceae bacterium]|mgnify:CR=1 FL=1|nr:polyprenyl synthetase family protein [Pyrinomonadaceae bacterium]